MFIDLLPTCLALAAIFVAGCVASFFIGRLLQRNIDRRDFRPALRPPPCRCGPPPAFRSQRPLFRNLH